MSATGSRAMVMHGTAVHTSGGLTKADLKYSKSGSIVSRRASAAAKRNVGNLGEFKVPTGSHVFGGGAAGVAAAPKRRRRRSSRTGLPVCHRKSKSRHCGKICIPHDSVCHI